MAQSAERGGFLRFKKRMPEAGNGVSGNGGRPENNGHALAHTETHGDEIKFIQFGPEGKLAHTKHTRKEEPYQSPYDSRIHQHGHEHADSVIRSFGKTPRDIYSPFPRTNRT
jgi:hypothetical protein